MKRSLVFGLAALGVMANAQVISSSKWSDLFSYNNVLSIRDTGNGKLIAATENGIFYYTPSTGEVTKLSKANGLHQVKISAFDYNPETKTGLVGYLDGSMDVITPEGITYIVDIPIATGYNGTKKINHISITGNQAAVSVGYGVSVFNLDKKEFGDTAFFNTGGSYESVSESVIKDNTVYAIATSGLKKHAINVTFPIYSEWQTIASGITNIDVDSFTIAYANANEVWTGDGTSFSSIGNFPGIKDVVVNGKYTSITTSTATEGSVYVYDGTGQVATNTYEKVLNTGFYNGKTFAGSRFDGILDTASKPFKPDGPYNNQSYRISLLDQQIWVATGGKVSYNDPANYGSMGYYHFNGSNWIYPEYFKSSPNYFNILDVVPNPSNPKDILFTNYVFNGTTKGIYKMTDDSFVAIYGTGQTYYDRIDGITFDENSQAFVAVNMISGATQSEGYFNISPTGNVTVNPIANAGGVQKPFTQNGILYIPSPYYNSGGVIMHNYKANNKETAIVKTDNNLPVNGVVDATLDKNGDLWIGTRNGLRVLSNPEKIFEDPKIKADAIIITQNNISEELFKDSEILKITVDSGNRKWVSVFDGGVYYLSPNGQNILAHYTKENSPLPTNTITDIQIDEKTGKVYFVTFDGIVTYQSDIVNVSENFNNVMVYPNPVVYSQYKGNVHFKGLAEKTNIRIVDAAGNLVHQGIARGGVFEWDLTNKGKRVASGIYFVLMTNTDGTDKATAKIAVVN